VDIFLHEGLLDDAIAALEGEPPFSDLIEQVANGAITRRPDWVVQVCRQQAEQIMDGGKSQHYGQAARWLEKVRAAIRAAHGEAEWQSYLEGLLARHGRKHALVRLLQQLA